MCFWLIEVFLWSHLQERIESQIFCMVTFAPLVSVLLPLRSLHSQVFFLFFFLNAQVIRLGSSGAISCNPQGLVDFLVWITNRCLWEDLSLSSGLHKGSAVVFCPLAHPDPLILSSRSSPRCPHWKPFTLPAAPMWQTSATHNSTTSKESWGVQPSCPVLPCCPHQVV